VSDLTLEAAALDYVLLLEQTATLTGESLTWREIAKAAMALLAQKHRAIEQLREQNRMLRQQHGLVSSHPEAA
jgi:cell shape-determining protein MreC